ncbi:hypothetical protein O7603_32195 [Micromonospora sp. WMMD812]|nr:hypothetical protein [Micromonospora sp. WMMD812]WBB71165.1 hypothetical protein O7603_32195 [Micromonospora sp. WMMD812]
MQVDEPAQRETLPLRAADQARTADARFATSSARRRAGGRAFRGAVPDRMDRRTPAGPASRQCPAHADEACCRSPPTPRGHRSGRAPGAGSGRSSDSRT